MSESLSLDVALSQLAATLDELGTTLKQERGIKSVQRGSTRAGTDRSTPISVTISSINPLKSFVLIDNSYLSTSGQSAVVSYGARLAGLSSTSVSFYPAMSGSATLSAADFSWQIIEFY